jgi:glycosyltransferase involved in cell wall biosynthesis
MRLAILGASGHGKVLADAAEQCGWPSVSFFDDAWPGLQTLLNACKLLLMEKPDIEFSLTIVGSGTDSERIKLISAELGIENQVTFLGEVKNGAPLNAIYSSHDVFIMPSLSETGPRVILEAMAQNLFCVATDVGYVSLLLGNKNDIGLLVEPGSEAAIKDALIWCYENKQETVEMASRARTQVSNYTLNNFISGVIGI